MIEYRKRIARADLRREPATLFVFGDNLQGRGLGGQAAEMRGEPNAVGIPTKRAPSMAPAAFLSDSDLDEFKVAACDPLRRLAEHLQAGGKVVWPADGIGTGLARLADRAPRIWASLERAREKLGTIRSE